MLPAPLICQRFFMSIETTKKGSHAQIDLSDTYLLIAISPQGDVFTSDISNGDAIHIAAMVGMLKVQLEIYSTILEDLALGKDVENE